MAPLFRPQVGCVGVAVALMVVLGFKVTDALAIQPVEVCVTVTE